MTNELNTTIPEETPRNQKWFKSHIRTWMGNCNQDAPNTVSICVDSIFYNGTIELTFDPRADDSERYDVYFNRTDGGEKSRFKGNSISIRYYGDDGFEVLRYDSNRVCTHTYRIEFSEIKSVAFLNPARCG